MPYFKDPSSKLHFLDNPEFSYLLPEGCVEITDEEASAVQAVAPAPEPAPEISPVEKLQAFLQANPDVATLIGVSQ